MVTAHVFAVSVGVAGSEKVKNTPHAVHVSYQWWHRERLGKHENPSIGLQ